MPQKHGNTRGSTVTKAEARSVIPEDPEQGIYFLGSEDSEYRVQLIMRNMPVHLMFEVPAELTSGEYEVEVRNLQRGHTTMRSDRLNAILVVS